MSAPTRRRYLERPDCWHVYYGAVRVGSIARRTGYAASYTANVFTKVVSADTAPVVVVIWSKYAADKVAQAEVPSQDQETEAELFKRTLLEAEPKYAGRLIFVEMSKPKNSDRPEEPAWTEELKTEIEAALSGMAWSRCRCGAKAA
jgi:hypothetical protein